MAKGFFLVLSTCAAFALGATPLAAQDPPASEEPAGTSSAVRVFFGASALGSAESLPGFAVGAELDGRLAIAEFLWVGLAAAFSGAPGFRVDVPGSCCDMISGAAGDAFALEGLFRVGFRGPLTPELTMGLLAGVGVAGVYGSGTRFGGLTGAQEFSEWWTVVQVPVELDFVWTIADVAIVVGAGPTFVFGGDRVLGIDLFDDDDRPRVGGRVRLGVLFAP